MAAGVSAECHRLGKAGKRPGHHTLYRHRQKYRISKLAAPRANIVGARRRKGPNRRRCKEATAAGSHVDVEASIAQVQKSSGDGSPNLEVGKRLWAGYDGRS